LWRTTVADSMSWLISFRTLDSFRNMGPEVVIHHQWWYFSHKSSTNLSPTASSYNASFSSRAYYSI
jgi:hypothetical protein